MLAIPGRCSAAKVILQVRCHSQISTAKLHSYLEWAPLFDWCKLLPKYCLTWLGQCNDSDLSQNSWELGILLVVPDNLYGVLIPQLTIILLFDPDLLWSPTPSWGHLTLSIFLSMGKRWGFLEPPWATIKNLLALFILLLVTWLKFYAHWVNSRLVIQNFSDSSGNQVYGTTLLCTTLCGQIKGKSRDTNLMYPWKEAYK